MGTQSINFYYNNSRKEGKWRYTEEIFLYSIEIKLVLIQTTLIKVKMLIVIPRATTKKIAQKYVVG